MGMTTQPFDALAEAYDAMIDWPKRLANEEPFYRWLFERVGAKRVLDASCGTGRHAAMFHSWGLHVEGADISEAMIRRCQASYAPSPNLRWTVRGYDHPVEPAGSFDVAICTGNSLALAPDMQTIERAVHQLLAAVRTGGALLIHVPNLWRMEDGPCQWQKCLRTRLSQGDSLIVKGMHRAGRRGYVDVIVTMLDAPAPTMHAESVPFWGLEAVESQAMARSAGASQVDLFGGYSRQPYERQSSADLILVAIR